MKSIKTLKQLMEKNRQRLHEEYSIKTLGIFGSYSKGKASPGSDLDVLVEFSQPPNFFKFVRLERTLSRLLGIPVDLATPNSLKPLIRKKILKEAIFV